LLDIYYPNNIEYTQFYSIIKEWNTMIYKYAALHNFQVIRISKVLTQKDDFSFGIEPSVNGGKKIVDLIETY
jgi:hypothetical protein